MASHLPTFTPPPPPPFLSPVMTAPLRTPKVGAPQPAGRRPPWFHVPAPDTNSRTSRFAQLSSDLRDLNLHTVCEEASCPNIGECWNSGTATIMLLGDTCTRGCKFCDVKTSSKPAPPDEAEPLNTAAAVAKWGVDYVVLTSVDRDDIVDGGAGHFARTVQYIKMLRGDMIVECLVGDFGGDLKSVDVVAASGVDVFAHNVETVKRLQRNVRDWRAGYERSLRVLKRAKEMDVFTKSGIMVGLGESEEEIVECMMDLREVGVDVLTIGQYLRPSEKHLSIVDWVEPRVFERLENVGRELGFKYVAAGPLVRSSYKAGEYFMEHMVRKERKSGGGGRGDGGE